MSVTVCVSDVELYGHQRLDERDIRRPLHGGGGRRMHAPAPATNPNMRSDEPERDRADTARAFAGYVPSRTDGDRAHARGQLRSVVPERHVHVRLPCLPHRGYPSPKPAPHTLPPGASPAAPFCILHVSTGTSHAAVSARAQQGVHRVHVPVPDDRRVQGGRQDRESHQSPPPREAPPPRHVHVHVPARAELCVRAPRRSPGPSRWSTSSAPSASRRGSV